MFTLSTGRESVSGLLLSTKISDICLQMACFTAILQDKYEEAFDSEKAAQLAFLKTSWRETGQNSSKSGLSVTSGTGDNVPISTTFKSSLFVRRHDSGPVVEDFGYNPDLLETT